jgi:2-dehydro-3-deoxyphosphogluconate aldolase/(4S)-4-hydroxy-2-oxoglutarate aldolase
MPTLVRDVTEYCSKKNIPVFPGAFTPQEIYDAWRAGATMVKVFPVKFFGPSYLGEVKGPFQNIDLLACGGVSPENIKTYFLGGASAVSFGGSVFKKEWLEKGEFDKVQQAIYELIQAV